MDSAGEMVAPCLEGRQGQVVYSSSALHGMENTLQFMYFMYWHAQHTQIYAHTTPHYLPSFQPSHTIKHKSSVLAPIASSANVLYQDSWGHCSASVSHHSCQTWEESSV